MPTSSPINQHIFETATAFLTGNHLFLSSQIDFVGVPDVLCILVDCTVCGKNACARNIHQRHLIPLLRVMPKLLGIFLNISVIRKISKHHVGVVMNDSAAYLAEHLSADALVGKLDNIVKLHIVVVYPKFFVISNVLSLYSPIGGLIYFIS